MNTPFQDHSLVAKLVAIESLPGRSRTAVSSLGECDHPVLPGTGGVGVTWLAGAGRTDECRKINGTGHGAGPD
jgi:hypothetical protein